MTIYIDAGYKDARDKLRHHLWADTVDELHEFASRVLGLKREEFKTSPPHYNVPGGKMFALSIRGGATMAYTAGMYSQHE